MSRILVVDDNEENRDVLSRRLTRRGFEVLLAAGGQEGIDITLAEQPDIVLMDLNMPEIDGWSATTELRKQDYKMPVIALTAHAMTGDRERAIEAGCNDYHTKPVDMTKLLQQIEKHLADATNQ